MKNELFAPADRLLLKETTMSAKVHLHMHVSDLGKSRDFYERFLGEGDKLKVTVRFRGRELAHPDLGRKLLLRMGERLREFGAMERAPILDGRQMTMVINPIHRAATRPETAKSS